MERGPDVRGRGERTREALVPEMGAQIEYEDEGGAAEAALAASGGGAWRVALLALAAMAALQVGLLHTTYVFLAADVSYRSRSWSLFAISWQHVGKRPSLAL
ncbi:hypothetical protein EVAR_96573_1 [Eumeta japonica]|uniref:Uncharacterized protein n=1 Tax=Eumeta variegata TaxID=151549 RepID=A0A4C1WUW0_EUMVA|nr:hypothetical protein EVAR_96573_1 [Eumeta japonica]